MAESVSKFAQEVVLPKVREMDEAEKMDPSLVEQLFEQGLMGIEIPEEYGGAGMNFTAGIVGIEELARVDPSVSVMVDVHNTLVNTAFLKYGTRESKRKWLPRLASQTVGSFCLSEPASGSDAFALRTKAEKSNSGYRINGSKMWITNSMEADIFIVFANLDFSKGYKGITAFVVEKGTKGFSIAKKEKKLGIRASSTCVINFDDVEIPKDHLLGEEGQGYKYAIGLLNEGRIGIAAQMTGLALGAWENAARYFLSVLSSSVSPSLPELIKIGEKNTLANKFTTDTCGMTANNSALSWAPSKACNTNSPKLTRKYPRLGPSCTTPHAKKKREKTLSETRRWRNYMHPKLLDELVDRLSSGWEGWGL